MKTLNNLKFYSPQQKNYITSFVDTLVNYYGSQLVSLAIFGSMARGENRPDSDCDLFIVLRNSSANETKLRRAELIDEFVKLEFKLFDLETKCYASGVSTEIVPVIFREKEASYFNPLYLDMTEHVVILIDQDDFLKNVLEKVTIKKKEWGSVKENFSNSWLWKIKPDLKWGEVLNYDL